MCTAQASTVPWTAIVGIAGILGTVLAAYLANVAAARRLSMEQLHEDKTRFHRERLDIYAKLLAASQSCRLAAVQCIHVFHRNGEDSEPGDQVAALHRCSEAVSDLIKAANAAALAASSPVHQLAQKILEIGSLDR